MTSELGLLGELPTEIFNKIIDQFVYFDDEWLGWPDESSNPEVSAIGAFTGEPFRDTGVMELMSTNKTFRKCLTVRILKANTMRFSNLDRLQCFFGRLRRFHGREILDLIHRLYFEVDIENSGSVADTIRLPCVLQPVKTKLTQFSDMKTFLITPCSVPNVVPEFPKLQSLEIDFKVHWDCSHRMWHCWNRHADDLGRNSVGLDPGFCKVRKALGKIQVQRPIISGLRSVDMAGDIEEEMRRNGLCDRK
ncbi:hypothetical protein MMC10_001446 [Thelotrema lepadinum]|nr:hypothetical protein [Thelotrema lepadinum]